MISRKSNAVAKANAEAVTMTKVQPATAFSAVVNNAKLARSSALAFCYSVTAYLLVVNHLQPANGEHYLSKADAIDYVKAQIEKQANVKGGMLSHYVRTGDELYSRLIGQGGKPTSLGAPIVKLLAEANDNLDGIQTAIDAISNMMESKAQVESFRDLSKALGFRSFQTVTGGKAQTAEKQIERITNVIKQVEGVREKGGKGAPQEASIVKAVAATVAKPLDLAKQAVIRYSQLDSADPDELSDLIELCNKTLDAILARTDKAKKATKGQTLAAKAAAKSKGATKRTTV